MVLAMFVLSEVSSMKPMRGNRLAMNGCRHVIRIWRAWPDLGPLLLDRLKVLFMHQTGAAQRPPDRHAADRHLVRISDFQHQIIQRQNRLGRHPRRDPVPQRGQLAVRLRFPGGTCLLVVT